MTGFSSPDVAAYWCYLLLAFLAFFVAARTVNTLLRTVEDRWAFAATWGLLFAHVGLPLLLYWFLDYTGAIHDTSLLAAAVVGFAYQQALSGGVQGISMPGQTALLWQPFQAWVDQVSKRITSRNLLYRDRFTEKVKARITRDPPLLRTFETIVWANTGNVNALQTATTPPALVATNNAEADTRRRLDVLWADLRLSKPDLYAWILARNRIVSQKYIANWARYWYWLARGRAQVVLVFALIICLVALAVLLHWLGGPAGRDRTDAAWHQYHTWRFLRANTTERDQWRSRNYLTQKLTAWGTSKVPPLSDAVAQVERAAADLTAAEKKATKFAVGSSERGQADAAVATADGALRTAMSIQQRALAANVVLPPLLRELQYHDISSAKATEILRLLVNCHSPTLNAAYVPDLIEGLRNQNEIVRLETRKTLVALNVDYPGATIKDEIGKWEPKKDETAADIDQRVRQWRAWWSAAQAVSQAQPGSRPRPSRRRSAAATRPTAYASSDRHRRVVTAPSGAACVNGRV